MAVNDAAHIKLLLKDLELTQDDRPLEIPEDNETCIAQANSGNGHVGNAKHYEVRLRFLQQKSLTKKLNSCTVLLIVRLLMYFLDLRMSQSSSGLKD